MGIFDAFTGRSQRRDLEQAAAEATAARQAAATQSIGTREDFLGRGLEFLEPQVGAGQSALDRLEAFSGAAGLPAQQEAFGTFQQDPGFQAQLGAGLDAVQNRAAGQGRFFSGGTQRDLFDFGQRFQRQAFNDRIGQLERLAGLGLPAATTSAGLTQQTGGQIADTQFGTGQMQANQAINLGNQMAASRNIPINNLLAIGEMAARAATGFA